MGPRVQGCQQGLYDEYRDALSVGMYRSGITNVNGAASSDLERVQRQPAGAS